MTNVDRAMPQAAALAGDAPSHASLSRPSAPAAIAKPAKPLGRKAYGSIPHLPGSRLGAGDHHCHLGQETICTTKARDRHDRIIVTEKLDGGNVAIAKVDGRIWALGRAGYPAITSPFEQHHHFDWWVNAGLGRWSAMLQEGEAVHGEWLAMAHGTIYDLDHEPFVAFDLTAKGKRLPHDEAVARCAFYCVTTAHVISDGPPITVDDAMTLLGDKGKHGARDLVEGAVWRVERRGEFDFLAKFVRSDKQDGKYLPEISGGDPFWHWRAPTLASVDTHPKDGDAVAAPLGSGAVPTADAQGSAQ